MNKLAGRTALVTGGSSGIGLAIGAALANDGAKVALVGRRQTLVEEAAAGIGRGAFGIAADVTKLADLDRAMAIAGERLGKLDILVCSAGSTGAGPLQTCTEAAFDELIALNVKSVFFTAQKALPLLNNPASVIIIGSVADTITLMGGGVYSASKAALLAFARTWANDLAPQGVRVNVLSPGITETPLLDRLQATDQSMAGFDALIANRTAMKRRGRPEEVAAAAAFLASDDSSYMTGGVIYADGGMATW